MSTNSAETPAFRDLGLPEPLLRATDELGFTRTTEIQALTLPVIAEGRDVAAQAQTGTGKTAAFLLGSFSRLIRKAPSPERRVDQPRMLVIAPTRELAIQIGNDAVELARHAELSTAVVYGGIDYEKQREQLAAGVDVLIGTPGRLIDYFKQKVFDLAALEIVVLDEADRMFDLGFIADIRFLLRRMPPPGERTSMLFSATLSHRVMELAYEHMNKPEELKTETTQVTAEGVVQSLYQPAQDEKIGLLLGLLRELDPPRSMVFVNTKRTAERIESYLVGNDIVCGLLSGDVRQNKRQRILADFTAGKIPLLIATDVAARGLHIDDVSHVFNYDLPQQAEDYVHRIGRTARAGSQGVAVSFACENYSFSLPEIQEYIGMNIPLVPITDELLVEPKRPARIERDRVERPGEKRGEKRGSRSGVRSGARSGARNGTRGEAGQGGRSGGRGGASADNERRPDAARGERHDEADGEPRADRTDGQQPGKIDSRAKGARRRVPTSTGNARRRPSAARPAGESSGTTPASEPVESAPARVAGAPTPDAAPDAGPPDAPRKRRRRRRRPAGQAAAGASADVDAESGAGPGDSADAAGD